MRDHRMGRCPKRRWQAGVAVVTGILGIAGPALVSTPSTAAPYVQRHIVEPDGATYVGEECHGVRHGHGTYMWPDGRKYVGDFRDGLPNGQGLYTLPNGESYRGEFRANHRAGTGLYLWPDGRSYKGQFADDLPHGNGVYTWPDGKTYAGSFRHGEVNGLGEFNWPDGRNYKGKVSEGVPHGKGTLTLPDGQQLAGSFYRGEFLGNSPASATVAEEIQMRLRGGTFTVPVRVNDLLTLDFHIDSGAADVSIPESIFEALRQAGRIELSDLEGAATYRMADGRPHTARIFRIRRLQMGSITRENVRASISDSSGPALLGMSFLGRLHSWAVDNERQVLIAK
ncbi:MAG: retroviral-like aspartic protease family protein [Enhydrobacter sp.]